MELVIAIALSALGGIGWMLLRGSRTPRTVPAQRRARGKVAPAGVAWPDSTPIVEADDGQKIGELEPPLLLELQLAIPEDLAPEDRLDIVERLAGTSMPSRAIHKLMSHSFMASASSRQLTELLVVEPILAAKIIGRANSAFYSPGSPILSVAHALTYLGMNSVRGLALQFTLEQAFPTDDDALKAYQARLLDTGTIATELVSILAPFFSIRDISVASTHAVLSFLGDFAMPRLMPQQAAVDYWPLGLLERTCHQQLHTRTNGGVVAELMIEAWGLPTDLAHGVGEVNALLKKPTEEPLKPDSRRLVLSYLCCRLAEPIALGSVHDTESLASWAESAPELYVVQKQLKDTGATDVLALLASPTVTRGVDRLIGGMQRQRSVNRQAVSPY